MRGTIGIGGVLSLALATLLSGACASATPTAPRGRAVTPDAELDRLIVDLEHDLIRARVREPQTASRRAASQMARSTVILTKDTILASLIMPVVDLSPGQLSDSWGASRDGGSRKHRGIDIFAPRGREIVAVADGVVTYIGNQPKGGRCLWLNTERGVSFYYAHLERWAPGLYEGMEVRQGTVLGYVGNTGNAISTPPHLHFGVVDGDETVNPYPILSRASRSRPRPVLTGGMTAAAGK